MLTVRDLSRNKQFRQILIFYSKDRKDTTQDVRDIPGTKGTKLQDKRRQSGHLRSFFLFISRVWIHASGYRASSQSSIHETPLLLIINIFIVVLFSLFCIIYHDSFIYLFFLVLPCQSRNHAVNQLEDQFFP